MLSQFRRIFVIKMGKNITGLLVKPDELQLMIKPSDATSIPCSSAAPDPASIYTGVQLILLKISGAFPNGDQWKCITCGVPAVS